VTEVSIPQTGFESDLLGPLRAINERIAVALSVEDGLVAMPLIVIYRECLVPLEQRGNAILGVFLCFAVALISPG
jgi:hypothetical protein